LRLRYIICSKYEKKWPDDDDDDKVKR